MPLSKNISWKQGFAGIFIIAMPVIILDQITKLWVLSRLKDKDPIVVFQTWFNLIYVENRGALWGMGNEFSDFYRKLIFLGFSTAIALVVAYLIFIKSESRIMTAAYAFVLGGAVGNLIDRFYLGFVVDFVDWHTNNSFHWATFNIADAAIVVAVGLMVIELITQELNKKGKNETKPL